MTRSSGRVLSDLAWAPAELLWVALALAVSVVDIMLFDLTSERPLGEGGVADSLTRLMFPAPPRPPARYEKPGINTEGLVGR